MCRIYETICRREEYKLTSSASTNVCILLSRAFQQKNEHFGNGRFVRNVYENTTMKQSSRLASLHQITKEQLSSIEASDIPLEMIADFDASYLDLSQSK
ncbi:hypothetical protein FACS1894170_05460 [Planctomycetales bacterium]|nr:hypothetical protein FACS1894170_05460 [Planctomycetales bacterium]